MFEIKNTDNATFILNSIENKVYLSFSEYGKFVGKARSTINKRFNTTELETKDVLLKGVLYKLITAEICLQLLIKDKPEKINIFVEDIFSLTGYYLKFPDFTSVGSSITSKQMYKSVGFIYLFESSLNLLKLGFTKNIKSRLKQLQRWNGELTIINIIEGSVYKEKEIHKILHATGEYFGDEWYPTDRKNEILTILQNL